MRGLAALSSRIEWGVASRPFPGEQVSGDTYVFEPLALGALIAVVDGLGHGAAAASSAEAAAAALKGHAREPLASLLARCHEGLKGKRGAAISVAALDIQEGTLTWMGVGNVIGVLLSGGADGRPERKHLTMHGGVVGQRLGPLRPAGLDFAHGDTLVFATDGIKAEFTDGLAPSGSCQQMADNILRRYGKTSDDVLVLVARLRGSP